MNAASVIKCNLVERGAAVPESGRMKTGHASQRPVYGVRNCADHTSPCMTGIGASQPRIGFVCREIGNVGAS